MAGWTEEGFVGSAEAPVAGEVPPVWSTSVSVEGVPWLTVAVLGTSLAILAVAGGLQEGLPLSRLLAYGAKATSLIFDRGETWRLLVANVLHKDLLHLACNAFVLWNVGGALERAVRPADYLATLVFTALGTTLTSAIGADSVSLGASGMAFGVLGASASFGWRRGVRGKLRNHFGLRLLPWLVALFAVGLGSSGVDNWGHAGGLAVGLGLGFFLEPRSIGTAFVGEGARRRLAAALSVCAVALGAGAIAAPWLPILGAPRIGPSAIAVRIPLGWRRAGEGRDRLSFTNGLSAGYRSTATVWVGPRAADCRAASCGCGDLEQLVRGMVETDLFRLLEAGPLTRLQIGPKAIATLLGGQPAQLLEGHLEAEGGEARVRAVCALAPGLGSAPVAVITLDPPGAPGDLAGRIAAALQLPPADPAHSKQPPSDPRNLRRASPVPRLSRPTPRPRAVRQPEAVRDQGIDRPVVGAEIQRAVAAQRRRHLHRRPGRERPAHAAVGHVDRGQRPGRIGRIGDASGPLRRRPARLAVERDDPLLVPRRVERHQPMVIRPDDDGPILRDGRPRRRVAAAGDAGGKPGPRRGVWGRVEEMGKMVSSTNPSLVDTTMG